MVSEVGEGDGNQPQPQPQPQICLVIEAPTCKLFA